jgi:hypothetical protein
MSNPGVITTHATGLGRTRGLGFDSTGNLYFTTESDSQDHGNSGILGMITPDGKMKTLIEGLDYPQFLAVYPNGAALIPFARENFIAMFNPTLPAKRLSSPYDKIDIFGVNLESGTSSVADTFLKLEFPDLGKSFSFSLKVPGTSGARGGWISMPFSTLGLSSAQLSYYSTELPYPVQPETPAPGFFPKPTVRCSIGDKPCATRVLSRRSHVGWRWPMTGPEGSEKPPAGFSESPDAFVINFFW